MAGGGLVPHTLPDGRTVMVPDYLAPKPSPLAMAPGASPKGPDMRVAGPGGGLGGFTDDGLSDGQLADLRQTASVNAMRQQLMPAAPPPTNEHAAPPKSRLDELAQIGSKATAGAGKVDPSTLLTSKPSQQGVAPQGESEDMDPMVRKVFNESLRRGQGGGGPRKAPGLEVATMQVRREPGKELIPELKWRYGLESRPDFGQELDPNAEQPTWGDADPVMRDRTTALEQASKGAGQAAAASFQEQENMRIEAANLERQALADQSRLIDDQLTTIAERRERVAKLQEGAEKRIREAESFEPRTRDQVWSEKGGLAQAMGILAMAIGGYTQGLGRSGGKNPGLEMVNKIIDDAVENDRYKAERRRKIGLDAKSDYEKALALYGDTEMATLEAKNRKLASVAGMAKQHLADRALDMSAKQRAAAIVAAAEEQVLLNAQQMYDMLNGKVMIDETYKPGVPTGGGGGAPSTLKALEEAARAKKAISTIAGQGETGYQRSIEGDKLNDVNAAMEALDAADAVDRDLRALGAANSDFDDPLSGPLDAAAKVVGTGGDGRRRRQALEANTARLARGIQQSLGKSDNDARLADQMAVGDGSGLSRAQAAETARRQALGRIQTATAGMTPQQREAFLQALPPERRDQVRDAMGAVALPRRAASEAPIE